MLLYLLNSMYMQFRISSWLICYNLIIVLSTYLKFWWAEYLVDQICTLLLYYFTNQNFKSLCQLTICFFEILFLFTYEILGKIYYFTLKLEMFVAINKSKNYTSKSYIVKNNKKYIFFNREVLLWIQIMKINIFKNENITVWNIISV
jgi:hypothetical protein